MYFLISCLHEIVLVNQINFFLMDLHISHERFGSISDPRINGHLHYPHDLDGPLNEVTTEKIRQYRGLLDIVNLCTFSSYRFIGKLTDFLQLQEFSLCNLPVVSSTTVSWCSPHSSNRKWTTSSPRLNHHR